MYRRQALGHGVAMAVCRLWDATQAIAYFLILSVRRNRRVHYAQQFLYKTEGGTFERNFAAFSATIDGRRLHHQRPDSIAMLRDRAGLQALPPNSLGRSYYDFMMAAQIDEDLYLAGAIEAGQRLARDPGRAWFRTRIEASHDMRHVLTGYGIDLFGETCLLAFRFGQTCHVGIFVFAALALPILAFRRQRRLMPAVHEAYRRGRAAKLLDLLPWEVALERPLVEIQWEFGLEPTRCYPTRIDELASIKEPIDICQTFGSLAAMHAALDREGIGMPCGIVVLFADKNEREIEAAIE